MKMCRLKAKKCSFFEQGNVAKFARFLAPQMYVYLSSKLFLKFSDQTRVVHQLCKSGSLQHSLAHLLELRFTHAFTSFQKAQPQGQSSILFLCQSIKWVKKPPRNPAFSHILPPDPFPSLPRHLAPVP